MARQDVGNYIYVLGIKFYNKLKCFPVYLYESELEEQQQKMKNLIESIALSDLVYLFNHIDMREYYDWSVVADYPDLQADLEEIGDDGWEGLLNEKYRDFMLLDIPVFSAEEYLQDRDVISEMYVFDIDNKCCIRTRKDKNSLVNEVYEVR